MTLKQISTYPGLIVSSNKAGRWVSESISREALARLKIVHYLGTE